MSQKLLSEQVMFYSMSKELSNFVQIRTEFDEEIDKGVLEGALKQAIVRYPYFKVKTAREEEELVLEENTAPLCVYDDADAPTLEPEKNQDYLFRVSAAGKMINISFLHAIADGGGFMPFVKTIFYYYWLQKTGQPPQMPDVHLAGDAIPEGELRDWMADFDEHQKMRTLSEKEENPFVLPVQKDPDRRVFVFTFTMDSHVFMKYSQEIDGSPNAIMALFMSRAIHKIHPDAENIIAGVAANFRKASGNLLGYRDNIGLLKLPYPPKMDQMEITTCATCARGSIILQSDDEVVRAGLVKSKQFTQYIQSLPTLEEKCRISSYAVMKGSGCVTFSVSYVGKQDYGELNDHIRFMGVVADVNLMPLEIEVMAMGEQFYITIGQNFADDVYVKGLIAGLEEEGITCRDYRNYTLPYEYGPEWG
ncbi:MAG: hypothetical protein LKM35_01025 [Lachnospiraceae bacterium]|jgi:hypothetical protein|nr:hypothetical protein [Lachnospiraceae bacterium]